MDAKEKEYFEQKRKSATTETENDLKKSITHLLEDIHDESLAVPQERPPELTVARTVARFAALISVLSIQSDKQVQKNIELQKDVHKLTVGLHKFTIALIVLAVIQIFAAIYPLFKRSGDSSGRPGITNQIVNTGR